MEWFVIHVLWHVSYRTTLGLLAALVQIAVPVTFLLFDNAANQPSSFGTATAIKQSSLYIGRQRPYFSSERPHEADLN